MGLTHVFFNIGGYMAIEMMTFSATWYRSRCSSEGWGRSIVAAECKGQRPSAADIDRWEREISENNSARDHAKGATYTIISFDVVSGGEDE